MRKTKRLGMHSGNANFSELDVRDKVRLPVDTLSEEFTERYVLEETFQRLPSINASIGVATNLDFEVLGTNASADDVTFSTTVGGIQLQTDGASSDQVIILPHLDTNQTAWTGVLWGTENQTIWEAIIRTGASVASTTIWAGLKLTSSFSTLTDDDKAFFKYTSASNWTTVDSIGGSDTTTDTGLAVEADTTYHLKIEINSSRKAKFYINDTLVYMSEAMTDDIDLIPYIGLQSDETATKDLNIIKQKISRVFFE